MVLFKVALTFTRAPNDPMFPDTPEEPQMVFCMLEACLVTLELPKNQSICCDVSGRLGRLEGFRRLFRLVRNC